MPEDPSPYSKDTETTIHRGALYEFRPIFWLHPPLWILRDIKYADPGEAHIYQWENLHNAFRIGTEGNEENVLARAKIRYVAVLSSTREGRRGSIKSILVAPLYTFKADNLSADAAVVVRSGRHPFYYFLPSDPRFPEPREHYIDFRKFQYLDKRFLTTGKLGISLTQVAAKAILERYKTYLSTE